METSPSKKYEVKGARPKTHPQQSKSISKSKVSQSLPLFQNNAKKLKKKVRFKTPTVSVSGINKKAVTDTKTSEREEYLVSEKSTGNIYSKPEFHSTLLLAERLQSIRFESFNEEEAVRKKLQNNEKVRKTIVHKSVQQVNIPPSAAIFRDLVPLDFDEKAFLKNIAEERELKFRRIQPKAPPKDPEPRIEDYLTPDLQPEFATIPIPQFNFQHLQTADSPPIPNQLYLHRRMWENLP